MIEFDASEIEDLAATLAQAGPRAVERTQLVVDQTGHASVRDMQQLAAVDTGTMKNSTSVDIDPDGLGFEAGPTVNYAPYVEYGTSRMSPQPFVGPGFERNIPPAISALEQVAAGMLDQ